MLAGCMISYEEDVMGNLQKRMLWSLNMKYLENNEKVIIGNIDNGQWIRVAKDVFTFLKDCLEKEMNMQEIIGECQDEYTKKYVIKLINNLEKMDILVSQSENCHEEQKPLEKVSIKLTNDCNLRCKHCVARCGDFKKKEISFDTVKEVVNWCEVNNVKSIFLTGGEILIRKDIVDIILYIGSQFSGKLFIITNAVLITNEIAHIIKENVNGVDISLDGYDEESVSAIRGKGVYNSVLKAIERLHEVDFYDISLSMVLTAKNQEHVSEFQSLCKQMQVKEMLRVLMPEGRAYDNYDELSTNISNQEQLTEQELLEKVNEYSFKCTCMGINDKFLINEDLHVYPCELLAIEDFHKGSVNELYTNDYKRFDTKILVDEIESCRQCNIRYFCASNCIGMDLSIFKNQVLREQRCKKSKEIFQYVWK